MLLHEQEKGQSNREAFFITLWTINAFLTFMFGWDKLDKLFHQPLAAIGLGDGFTGIVSHLMGGLVALFVCDVAYIQWDRLKLSAETSEQMGIASVASILSLVISLGYSAVSLIETAFPTWFSTQVVTGVGFVGAVVFIGLTIAQIVWAVMYTKNSADVRRVSAEVKFDTLAQSEQLAAQAGVYRAALGLASGKIRQDAGAMAEEIAHAWSSGLQTTIQGNAPTLFEYAASANAPRIVQAKLSQPTPTPPTTRHHEEEVVAQPSDKGGDDFLSASGMRSA